MRRVSTHLEEEAAEVVQALDLLDTSVGRCTRWEETPRQTQVTLEGLQVPSIAVAPW